MSPLQVQILLWYHSRCEDFPNLRAPAVADALSDFVRCGILEMGIGNTETKFYPVRAALDLYVEAVCAVPLPKLEWTMEGVTE